MPKEAIEIAKVQGVFRAFKSVPSEQETITGEVLTSRNMGMQLQDAAGNTASLFTTVLGAPDSEAMIAVSRLAAQQEVVLRGRMMSVGADFDGNVRVGLFRPELVNGLVPGSE